MPAEKYQTCSALDEVAVTPHDTNPVVSTHINGPYRALYIGGGGHVTIKTPYGDTVEHKNVPAGKTLTCAGTHVTTATTATSIVAWF